MAWDEIKFKISADMDFGNAINQVKAIKNGIGELKDSITDMPNVTKILDNSFEKSATVADELITNLSKLQDKNLNQNTRESIESKARTNLSELNALRTMQLGKTDYSVQIAKAWFGNLPKNIQRQFDTMAPQISSIIRTRLSSLSKNGNGIKAVTPGAIAKVLTGGSSADTSKMDADLRRLVEKNHLNQEGLFQLDNFIKYLIPAVSPMNRFGGYQKARYGTIRQGTRADLFSGINPVDLFPESYKETFRSKGQAFNVFDKSYQSKVLDTEYRRKVDDLLKSNPIAVKAALASGISRRDNRGILETKDEISRSDWEGFRKALYDDLLVRVSGFKGNAINAYKATGKDKKTLMSRLTSSSSGQAMLAMEAIEAMEGNNAWINAAGIDTYKKLPSEGKRILNQHVVDKYSLFAPSAGLQFKDPRKVMISESHNTRLLGNNQWRNNQDVSDTISVVSLAGYDPKNKEHKAALEGLFSEKGTKIGNQTYVAQSIHGTGSDTVIRMIEKKAYDRVNAQERAWIESHPDEAVRGIRGEYWKGFENKEIERLIENGITSKDWGKHLEMLNKPWTPTQEVGINVDGKRFAVVNTRGFGDGGAWFSNNVIPHSGQFRGGLGLKGSAFVFEGNSMGALGKKAGLVDDQGRMMMEGPDGQLYDVSGYDGIIPLDVIKNKGILKDENGNYVSGDIASRRMTAMLQRYPMAYHADYDIEDRSSGHIGTQMASFMMLSPKVRAHQIEMAMKVMNALDTESGQLKYVFGDQNDYLSKKVNEDTSLLASDEARARIDAKRASLIGNIISGQYTDFEDDNSIADLRAAANPVASILLAEEKRLEEARKSGNTDVVKGINTNGVIAKARYYLEQDAIKKKELNPDYVAPQYTDQQIRDMIILPKGKVVDFNRKDVKNVSIARSPTGFGNFFNAENIAEIAEPIYKGFGVSTKAGIYVSEQNTDQLQSMDFDADQVKAIYDQELAESIGETLKTMEYKKADVSSKGVEFTPEELRSRAIQARSYTERSLSAPLGMGTGSAGIRVMQLDYSRPENRMLVEGARRAAGIYDIASTPKSGLEYVMEDEDPVWKLLGLGKEYTKFSNGLDALFKFDEDMLDEKGNPLTSHPDYYKASNGKDVNLRALRAMGIDEINLPSRYMANHLMAISDVGNLYRHGLVDTTLIDAAYEAMNTQLGYGDAGESTKNLMQAMRLMRVQFGTGERGFIANNEVENIQNLIDAADAEIELSASKFFDASSGKYIKDNKVYNSKNEFIEAQRKKYGVKTAKNAIGNMGMVEQDLTDSYGEDYVRENFINSTDLIRNEEQEKQIQLQQREAENKLRIQELQQKAEAEKSNSKEKRKKKTTEQSLIDKEMNALQKQLNIDDKTDLVARAKAIEGAISADKVALEHQEEMNGDPEFIKSLRTSIDENKGKLQGINKYKELLAKRDELNKSPTERALAEALKEQAQIASEKEESSHLADLRLEFQGILSSAKEYNGSLYASRKGKENKIDDIGTPASRYWNRGFFQTNKEIQELDAFSERIENSGFKDETKQTMLTQISAIKERMTDNFIMDFADNAILSAKNVSESISNELNKEQKAVTPQKQKIDNYTKEINDLQRYIDLMQEKIDKNEINDTQKKAYEESINKTKEYIDTAEKGKKQLIEEYTKQNEKAGRRAVNGLYEKYGLRNKKSLSAQVEARKDEIQSVRDVVNKQHEEGKYTDDEYNEISAQLDALEQKANKVSIVTQDMMNKVGGIVGNLTHRFTHQLFQRALQETKRFVKEFDSSMNEIQAITLKSDSEMQGIRSQTINKAIGLRTSVSNVATTEAALYRQGLSDAEVSSRTDSIIKFATVTKLNVAEATKIITTALQNDLVPSAEQAMDALVALGDSAATTAAEIGKGMQKAAASAKVAGVSYAELTALLTIGTSDTQLSGTQVGTALQTVFSRMRRLSISGYTADQNGEKTTASDAEAALKSVGVDLWDDKTIGKMRSAYDVLSDLSKVWQNLSDAQKNIVMNALAGTRQTNVFSTLMEGMAEDGGATLDKYLGLAEGSEGITQTKYEIAMQSLSASMDTLKSSWDSVVESFTNSGLITGTLDLVSGFLQMISNTASNGGQIDAVFGAIIAGIGGMAAACLAAKTAVAPIASLIGILVGGAITVGAGFIQSLIHTPSAEEIATEERKNKLASIGNTKKITDAQTSDIQKAIKAVEDTGNAWKINNNVENTDALRIALQSLADVFPAVSSSVQGALSNLQNWTQVVQSAKQEVNSFNEEADRSVIDKTNDYIRDTLHADYINYVKHNVSNNSDAEEIIKSVDKHVKGKYDRANSSYRDTGDLLWSSDNEMKARVLTKEYRDNEKFRLYAQRFLNPELISQIEDANNKNLYNDEAFVDAASRKYNDIFNALYNAKEANESDEISLNALKAAQKQGEGQRIIPKYINDNETINWSQFISGDEVENAYAFRRMAQDNKAVQNWLKINNSDIYEKGLNNTDNQTVSDISQAYAQFKIDSSDFAARRKATRTFLKAKLPEVMSSEFDMMSNDEYSQEAVQKLFIRGLESFIASNPDFIDESGEYNEAMLQKFVDEFSEGWYDNREGFLTEYKKKYGKYNDFAYHVYEDNPDTWFNNYEDAIDYIRKNNLGYDQLKDSNGNVAYQTADKLISAKRQESRINNRQILLDDILNGYSDVSGFRTMTEKERLEVVKSRNRSGFDAQNDYWALLEGNLVAPLTDFVAEGKNLEDLKNAYKEKGLDQELSKAVSSNYTALLGWITDDLDMVFQGLEEELNGNSTAASQSAAMGSLLNKLSDNRGELVSVIETDFENAYKSILSYFGDENGKAILSSMKNGTYKNSEWERLVNRTLAENALKPDAGLTQYTNVELADLANQAMYGGYNSLAEAAQGLGWTKGKYNAVQSAYGSDIDRYLNMTETQRQSVEGQNLKRNFDIKIGVVGVSELEAANQVLEGTTQLIENLKKGGTIELKAKLNFENQLYSNEQQAALLENGTYEEQLNAIMALTGRSKTQVQNDFEGSKTSARNIVSQNRNVTTKTLIELSKTDPELARSLAADYGYEYSGKGMSQEEALKAVNDYFGYSGEDYQFYYDSNNDELYYNYSGSRLKASDIARKKFDENIGSYNYSGTTGQPDREDLLAGLEESYSATRIASAQRALLMGKDISDNELYKQAVSGLTQNQRDFIALRQKRDAGEYVAQSHYDTAKAKADADTARQIREAQEQDELAEAEALAGTSFSAANRYARVAYEQRNKSGLAANALYESLTGLGEGTSAEDINKVFEGEGLSNWEELLKSAPDLTEAFKDMGHAVKEDGSINWSAIEEAEGGLSKALSDLIQIIASHSTDYQKAEYKTRSQTYQNALAYDPTTASGYYDDYASVVGSDIAARRAANILTPEEQSYAQQLLDNYGKGIIGLTDEQKVQRAQQLYDAVLNETYGETYGNASPEMISAYAGQVEGLQELIDLYNEGKIDTKEFAERTADVGTALESASLQAQNYGEYLNETDQAVKNLSKGGKSAAQELAKIKNNVLNFQDTLTAVSKARGKEGKALDSKTRSFLANYLGIDEKSIQKYTKKELDGILDKVEEGVNEEFNANSFQPILQKAFTDINAAMDNEAITYEQVVDVVTKVNESGDMSAFIALLESINSDYAAIAASMAGELASYYINIVKSQNGEGAKIDVVSSASTSNASLKPDVKYHGGGGGGGGGKSATDKLLEEQKRKVAEIEHQSKMLEIQEKQYDYTNDYSGWNNNISDQIAVQEQLRAQYAANIKEMTDMLAKVKEGSDDWKKLKDAIMQAEEAMASINNTVNELNGKQISILQQQQENADKPDSHALTMLQKRAERYQTTGQFEGYAATMQQSIDITKKQIDQNNNQIKEWEDLLLQYEEGSDSWIETRDNIWKLKEENASLENQVTSDMIDLQDAKINQIAQDLQNQQASFEHSNAILETYGGMYQSMNNQAGYRGTLQDTITNNTQLKELNDAAIEELRAEIEAMEESDPSRQNAIQTLYQLEEASAQYEASILSNRQAIEESLINELTQGYSDTGSTLDHELKLLQEAEKEFLRDDDFVNYENILSEESRNAEQRLQNQRDALASYLELQSSGQITEGSQQWRDLEETIRQTKESIATLSNEYEGLIDKIQTARFENLQKNFTEADELAQHNLKMIQYEETRYQNRGELTNYGTLLAQDTDMQRERAADISNYIENLKEQLEVVKDNPELYKKITQEIYKYEEQLSSVNNTIEKNEKLLIKNEEAIRKVRMAVENSLDKAIRERIQRQREMLQATVSIENSILDVIRKNKQEEWNLEKKTLDIKKQALNEEKNLINERLNARKEALNEEEKYEELAELQRQLALISADTTRTKDAAELRKQIADIQKDISWDLASDQANASIQAIDDEIKAIDSYTATYEEDLNEMLSDANNFTDDLNATMGGSFDEFLEWMKANNEAYKLATDEAKQVMEQGWEDTWKKMKDELDSYWSEVDESMRSREGFIEYMRGTDAYRLASDTGRASLEHQWGEMYDNYTASLIDNAEFDHDHQLIDKVDELKGWTFNVKIEGIEDYLLGMDYSNYAYNRRTDYEEYDSYDNYAGIGKKKEPEPKYEVPNTPPASNKTSGTGQTNGKKLYSQVEVLTGKENPSQKDIDELKKKYPWLEGLPLDPRKKYTEEELEKLYSTHERLTGKNLVGIGSLLDKYNTVSIPEPPFASSSALNQLVSTYSNNNNSGSFNLNFYGGIQVREEADIDKVATELEHKVAKTLIKQGQNNYFSLAR